MRLMIESTDKVTLIEGILCRVWNGTTEAGSPCLVFIPRLSVNLDQGDEVIAAFERELEEQLPSTQFVPLNLVL